MVVRKGINLIHLDVDFHGDEVDTKNNKGDVEFRSVVTHLIVKHGMLPPHVPPHVELWCMLFSIPFF